MTNALLLVVTLLGFDVLLSILVLRSPLFEKIINDIPVVIVSDGVPDEPRMTRLRVSAEDVLENLQDAVRDRAIRPDQVRSSGTEREYHDCPAPGRLGDATRGRWRTGALRIGRAGPES